MVYKKYIKRGNKIYGPYRYHSRKVDGKVLTDYLGKHEKKKKKKTLKKKNKTLIFLIIGFILLFSLVFFALNYKNMTSFVISEEVVNNQSENENNLAFIKFVIELTKAEHLDSNRQFISDIYEEVKALDDIWSETINNNEYVRITFEENLTNEKDITIYPRIVNGTPKIEVYEANKNEIIAEFTNIISNEYNKVLLTNLSQRDDSSEPQRTQDVFDLLILGGSLEFEHIVDPQAEPGGEVELRPQTCAVGDKEGTQDTYDGTCDGSYPGACPAGGTDYLSCHDDNVESTTYNANTYAGYLINFSNTSITNCDTITEVFLCWEWWATSSDATASGIEVDANNGASFTPINTTIIGASANPGLYCQDVTAAETWTCSVFFSSGNAAIARNYVTRTSGGGPDTINQDALFFNVTYAGPVTDASPIVTLNSPADYANFSSTIDFNCTATDDIKLENVSLYGNWTGWHLNDTNTPANNTPTIFSKTIPTNGIYVWNCYACDNKTIPQCVFAGSNRTFTVDSIPPYFTDFANQTSYDNTSLSYDINATDDTIGLDGFDIDDTTNFSIDYSTGIITNSTTLVEYYYIVNVSINDTLGNLNWSLWSLNVTETPDTTAPVITSFSPTNTSYSISTIFFNASADETIDTWIVNYNGTNHTLASINSTLTVEDGHHHLLFYGNDSSGNFGLNDSIYFTVDSTPPIAAFETDPVDAYNSTSQSITFNLSCSDNLGGGTLQLWGNWTGTWHANQTNSSPINDTTWSIQVNNIPEEKGHIWGVWCNDSLGNENMTGTNRTFTVDATAPTIALPVYTNATQYRNDQSMIFNISVSDGASYCSINVDDNTNQTVTVSGGWCNGTYALTGIGDGNKTINAYANDTIGNTALNDSYVVWIDSTSPTITHDSPLNGTYFNYAPYFNGTCSDSGVGLNSIYTNLTGYNSIDTSSPYNFTNTTGLTEGIYSVRINCNDTVNNTATLNFYFTFDDINPTATINRPANNTNTTDNTPNINITLKDNIGSAINYTFYINDTTNKTGILANNTSTNVTMDELVDGLYRIKVQATDNASNNANSSEIWITIDSTPPYFTDLTNQTSYNNENLSYDINATDNIIGLDGFGIDDITNFSIDYSTGIITNITTLVEYYYIVNVSVNDTLGNLNWSLWGLDVTLVAGDASPIVTLNSPVNNSNSTGTVTFNCTASDDINLVNASLYGNWTGWHLNDTNTPANNTPTIFSKTISDGTYIWNCYACDNKTIPQCSFATPNRTFTVDSTSPYFTDLDNQTSYDNKSLSYDINATDNIIGLDGFGIDDITNFSIDYSTGIITNITTLVEYYYIVNVSVNDTLGNLNWSLWSLNVTETPDTTSPIAAFETNPVDNYNSTSQSITFELNCSDNSGVDYLILYGNWTGTWHANQTNSSPINDTTWSIQVNSIPEGTGNIWSVWCNDSSGNENMAGTNRTFNIDSTKPNVTINLPINQTYTTNSITFNVTATNGGSISSCLYSLTGGSVNYTMSQSGDFYTDTNSSMIQGSHTVNYYCNDSYNNLNNTEQVTFFIDSVYPLIDYESETPSNNSKLSQNYIYVNVTWTETNFKNITYRLYNSTSEVNTTVYTTEIYQINYTSLPNKIYTYNVTICDILNQCNTTTTRTITLDITYPIVNIIYPQNTDYTVNVSQLNYTYTETNPHKCWWSNSSGVWNSSLQTCGTNWTGLTSVEGSNTWTVYINDTTGNENSSSVTFTKDTAYPAVTINSPINQTYNTNSITFNVTATDGGSISSCWYSLTSGVTNNSLTNFTGNYYTDTNSSMNQGSHTVNYYCNDSYDNLNDTEQVTFFIDSIIPLINFTTGTEGNDTTFSRNWIFANVTVTEDNEDTITFSLFNETALVNETSYKDSTRIINWTGLSNAIYYYNVTVNDTAGNSNNTNTQKIILDTEGPQVSSLAESPTDPTNYSESKTYMFNATITDPSLDVVWVDFNGTNYTATPLGNHIYNITLNNLSVGTYDYRWYANDSFSNLNNSENGTYTINQGVPNLTLTITPSTSEVYGTQTTATDSSCPSQLTCKLYRNDTGEIISPPDIATLGVGAYNYTYNTTGNANYTSASVSDILTITQNTGACDVVFNDTSPVDYGTSFLVWTNCTSGFVLYRNGTEISNNSEQNLAASSYNFTVIRNDTVNYSNYYDAETFIVQQATGEVYTWINNQKDNETIEQYTEIYLNGTLETGQAGENIKLYYNDTLIAQGTPSLYNLTNFTTIGLFNITTIYDGNENYTSAYKTWWVNVTAADVTSPQISVIYPQNTTYTSIQTQLNYTASDNIGLDDCWYSTDGGSTNTTITCGQNITGLNSGQNSSTWTVWANDSKNNINSSSVTFFVDSINPTIQFANPTETSGISLGRNYIQINVTASDDNLDTITIRLYNSTSLVQTNTSSTSPFPINYTGLSEETYYFNATANDTLNNQGSTETKNVTLVLPSLTIIRPENETYLTNTSVLLNYSVEYEDTVKYNIDLTGSNHTITSNTTFNTSEGQHTLYLYANNSLGTTIKNVTFTINLTKFTIYYDEYKGSNKGGSKNFNKYSYNDMQNLSNIILEHTSHGKISFNQAINLTADGNFSDNSLDLNTNTDISNNRIEIDSTALPNFNKNATLYFYGLSLTNPRALRDSIVCPSTICTTPALSAGIWSFNVTGFTIYSLEETTGVTPTTPSGGSGGSGFNYVAKCVNNSDCKGEDEICWNGKCVKLFDIKITDFESPVKLGDFFHFTYLIKGMADISDDVEVRFWIEKNGEKVTSGSDTIYLGNFEEKIETTKIFFPSDVESGTYVFYVQVVHQAYQAKSHRTIQIEVKEGFAKIISEPKDFKTYVICALIVLIVFILFFILYLERKKIKKKFMQEEKWIKKHKVLLLILSLFIVLLVLVCYLNLFELISNLVFKAICWVRANIPFSYFYYGLGVIFSLVILVSLTIIIKKKKLFEQFKYWRGKTKNRIFLRKRRADELLKEKYKAEAEKSDREFKRVSKMSDRLGKKLKNCLIKSQRGIKLLIGFLKRNIILFVGLIKKHRREEKKEIRLMRKLYQKKRKGELIERRKEKKRTALIKRLSRKKRRKELIKIKKERKKELIEKKRVGKEGLKKREREKERIKKRLQNVLEKTEIQIKRIAQFFVRKTKEIKSNLKDIRKYNGEKRKERLEKKRELHKNKELIKKNQQFSNKKKELIEKERTRKRFQNIVKKTGVGIKRIAQFFVRKTKEIKSNLKDIRKYNGEKRKERLEKKRELHKNKELIKKNQQFSNKKKELIEKGKKILEEAKRFEKRKVEKIRRKIKFQNIVNKYKIQIKKIKRILKESIKKISKIDIKKAINKFPKIKLPKRHLPKPIIKPEKSLEEEEKLKIPKKDKIKKIVKSLKNKFKALKLAVPKKEKDRIKIKREPLKNVKRQIKQIYKNTFKLLKKILRRKPEKKIIHGFETNLIKTEKFTQQHLKALKNIVSTKADFEKKQLQIGFEKDKLNFQNKINKIRRNTGILINKLTGHLNNLISLKKRKRIKTKEPEKKNIEGKKLIKDFFSKGITQKQIDKPAEQLIERVEKEKKKRINLTKIGNKLKKGVTKTSGKIFNYTKSFSSKKINKIRNRLKERPKLREKPESAEQLIKEIKAEDKKKRRVNKLNEFIKKIKEKIFISPREREKQKNLKRIKEMFEEED